MFTGVIPELVAKMPMPLLVEDSRTSPETSRPARSWLNADAPLNISIILATFIVFQLPMG
jgi:hypothetical protein